MIDINKTKLILIIIACVVSIVSLVSSMPKVWHPPEEIVPQGAGSGLDADKLDGLHFNEVVDAAVAASGGGACYINWDGIGCYTGYTAILKGKITVSSDPQYGSGGIMCTNIPDKTSSQGWGVVVEQSNMDCAICCI